MSQILHNRTERWKIDKITGTKFNKAPKNISKEEEKALEELIELQKTRQIIIKPVDKGGGIMVTDFEDYVKACQIKFPN